MSEHGSGPARSARLHAVVPQLSAELLRQRVRQRLGRAFGDPGDWRADPGGQILHGGPFAVLVADSWDGPELWVGLAAAPDAARSVELLLREGEMEADLDRACGPPLAAGWAGRGPHEVWAGLPAGAGDVTAAAHAAWRAMLRARGVPDETCVEVGTGVGAGHGAGRRGEFAFDWGGAPALPAGWLARSWSNPVAGRVQFSVRGGPVSSRLILQSPGLATVQELNSLLADWLDALTELTERAAGVV